MKNNPIYSKIFASIKNRSTELLKNGFVLLTLMAPSRERSITMACIIEELEGRISEQEVNELLELQ